MTKSCETCGHYKAGEADTGECRRHPPSKPSNFSDEAWSQPIVRKDGVCGEHSPK